MTPSKYVNKLWQQAVQIMHTLNERTNGWLWVLANSIKQTLMPDTAIMASAIAYISLFSLFPLIKGRGVFDNSNLFVSDWASILI